MKTMSNSHRTCEICGIKEKRSSEKLFFARFPRNKSRCLEWVQSVGKEDLAYIPVEKLHELRHICKIHFSKRDFTKTKTRLKKRAVPRLHLSSAPLSDNIVHEFLRLNSHANKKSSNEDHLYSRKRHHDHTYYCELGANEVACKKVLYTGIPPTTTSNKNTPRNERTGLVTETVTKKGKTQLGSPDNEAVDDVIQYDEETSNINEEDSHNDQVLQSKTVEPSEPFSWQKSASVRWDADTEANEKDLLMQCDEADELYMYPESGVSSAGTRGGEDAVPVTGHLDRIQQEYRCNECSVNISGFLYTCVQCADYDLCASCEARGCHPNHYVLRVPGGRPHGEVLSVLQTLRRVLVTDSVVQMDHTTVDELKVEVKEEAVDPIDVEQVEVGPGGPREESYDSEQDIETAEEDEDPNALEENIDTLGENVEIEEDSEAIKEYLDTESSWSLHSQRSDLPEYVYSTNTVQGTRPCYMAPDTSQELYYVVGLDEQNRNLDVRLSEDKKTTLKRRLVEPKTYRRKTTDVERGVPVSSNTLQTHMAVPRVVLEDISAARKS